MSDKYTFKKEEEIISEISIYLKWPKAYDSVIAVLKEVLFYVPWETIKWEVQMMGISVQLKFGGQQQALLLTMVKGEEIAQRVWPECYPHFFLALLCSPEISSTFFLYWSAYAIA